MTEITYQVVYAPAAQLVALNNVRRDATPEADAQLTESIRRHGILQPIGVRPEGDKLRIVWGFRRFRCGVAAGLAEFPVVVLNEDMTEGECLTLMMIENVQRADLSAFDMYQGCVRLQEAHPGVPLQELAKKLSISAGMMTKWLSPAKLVPAWLDALKAGKVGISDCYSASQLDADAQGGLLALKLSGANAEKVAQAARKARNPPAPPAEKVTRIKCEVPGKRATVTISGDALTIDSMIEAMSDLIKLARREAEKGVTAKTFERLCKELSKKA